MSAELQVEAQIQELAGAIQALQSEDRTPAQQAVGVQQNPAGTKVSEATG